jgi:peptidoglycan hydrolase CwlO-like protein
MVKLMIPCKTPKARVGRVGVWASPLLAALLLLVFLSVMPLSSAAQGATQSDILKQQLSNKLAAAEQASSNLTALKNEIAALEKNRGAAAQKLADLDAEIGDVEDAIDQAEIDLMALRSQLENRLVNMYKDGTSWTLQYLEAIVAESSLTAVLDRFDMVTRMADQDQELFTEVEGYIEKSEADRVLLEQKKAEQQSQLDELVHSLEQSTAKRAQFATQYASLQSQIASLRTDIRRAEAQEAAAAAAARLKAIADAAKKSSDNVGPTTPTTAPKTTPTTTGGTSSGVAKPPTSAAEIQRQANLIYWTFLAPRKSVLTGQMIMDVWIKHGISPAGALAVLNAETGMGSTRYGGRLVTEANNFGCITYREDPKWLKLYGPPIAHGKIYVGTRYWMKFYSVADGIEAWARCIHYGLGKDRYRPLLNSGNWTVFADIYYGANVAGKARYLTRLNDQYYLLMKVSKAAGMSW